MSNEVELMAENWKQNSAPEGLVLDDSADGSANASLLAAFIQNNRLPWTPESLSTAARMEAKRLAWKPGFEPGAAEAKAAAVLAAKADAEAARRKRDGVDTIGSGGRGRQDSHTDIVADQIERAKANAARQVTEDARAKHAADVALRQKEETAWIYYDNNGRINMGESLTQQARAKAKWAAYFGEAAPAPTTLRDFSADGPELSKAELYALTKEELARYIKSRNALRWQSRR